MRNIPIGVIVGSARKGSYSKIVAKTVMEFMPAGFDLRVLEIADLPIFNQDYDDEGKVPASYSRFRDQVRECAGFLFVTPEHNRTVPALLKNALDVASRPPGHNVWSGRPGAVISVSPSGIGAFGSNHVLRQSMAFLNVFMMQQPEAYIGGIVDSIGADGKIADEKRLAFLKTAAESFAAWVGRFEKGSGADS